MSASLRRSVFAAAVFSLMPRLVACPKKDPPPVDAAPPEPVVEQDSAPIQIAPLEEEDAGEDAGEDADAGKKYTGKAVNPNVARLKRCCAALSAEAKR